MLYSIYDVMCRTPYLAWFLLVIYMLLVCFVGLVMYAYYFDCDPFTDERVESVDQVEWRALTR